MKKGKMLFGSVFIFIAIGMLTATVPAQTKIGGLKWQLTELNGQQISNSRVYVEFDETAMRLSGHAGCNRFFGGYDRKGQTFKVLGAGSTRMACLKPGLMETEQQFLEALNDATRLRRNGQILSIFNGRQRLLRFAAQDRETGDGSSVLTSKKWILRSIGSTPVKLGTRSPFLNFDPEKMSAGGNSGCNGYGGSYSVSGSNLSITDVISTMMACEAEGRMQIERGLFDGLRETDRFEIKGGMLLLFKGAKVLLEFEGSAK